MNAIHKHRLAIIILMMTGLAIAASLIFYALNKNINLFLTPSDIISKNISTDYAIRLGGMVKKKSIIREKNNLTIQFIITDLKHEITIHYTGILPDLFREGKGAVAEGYLNSKGELMATQILAKHDENYMPPNLSHTLKENAT